MQKQLKQIALTVIMLASVSVNANPSSHGHGHGHWDRECSPLLMFRTPTEVLEDHRAALAAQDWQAVRCNYSRNAIVISDQGVDEGRDAIVASLQGLAGFFGSVTPTVLEDVVVRNMVRTLFEVDLGWLIIPDGIDTYIIRRGKIRRQTAHGTAIILGPPPGPMP